MQRAPLIALMLLLMTLPALAADAPSKTPTPNVDQAALDKLGWRLGCQAWTFRKVSLFETIDLLNKLGIRYIELYPGQKLAPGADEKADHNMSPEALDRLIKKLKDANVTPVSYGVVGLSNDEAA